MSDEHPSTDEDLVRRVRAGDEAAARKLFGRARAAMAGNLRDSKAPGS